MKPILYKNILLTHDGSDVSSAAIPYALSLATACNAELLILTVIPSVPMEVARISYTGIGGYPVDFTEIAKEIVKECRVNAQKMIEKIKENSVKQGVKKVTGYIKEGEAEDTILSTAKNNHCDVIVMSTHGRSGLSHVLLGSVTEYVIRHARCPVLAVHPNR